MFVWSTPACPRLAEMVDVCLEYEVRVQAPPVVDTRSEYKHHRLLNSNQLKQVNFGALPATTNVGCT